MKPASKVFGALKSGLKLNKGATAATGAPAAAAAGATQPLVRMEEAPPAPCAARLRAGDMGEWELTIGRQFFKANREVQQAFADYVGRRISAAVYPAAVPGPATAARATAVLSEISTDFQQSYSDAAGGMKATIMANLMAAWDNTSNFEEHIIEYGARNKIDVQYVLQDLARFKKMIADELGSAESAFNSSNFSDHWAAAARHPKFESACANIAPSPAGVSDFKGSVKAVMTSYKHFSSSNFITPPKGEDASTCELRFHACAITLYTSLDGVQRMNEACKYFREPKNVFSLSDNFRLRRELLCRSLVMLQEVERAHKLLDKEVSPGARSLLTIRLEGAQHVLPGKAYDYDQAAGTLYTALSTAILRHNTTVAGEARTEAASALKKAEDVEQQAVQQQQELQQLRTELHNLTRDVKTLKRGRDDEGACEEQPGAKRTPTAAHRFRDAEAALAAAAPAASPAPAPSAARELSSHPIMLSGTAKLAGAAAQPSLAVAAVTARSPLLSHPLNIPAEVRSHPLHFPRC
ncbi:myosin-7B isoform X1 [Chlorella sorokiniana]|uniref:Myosin-7B isoform X1 n=1 Tax=Chlorella sorokiniana TaxID=3076 RepID=A0A2P6TWS3_CHLSO|nr:myosin-7B isoform X1 [Chlorella sorokiniana]|eukprot:PRW58510.1 myosin-7B isoform X1 [Chlorella sorokiniana]